MNDTNSIASHTIEGPSSVMPCHFLPFTSARDFVLKLGLKSKQEWGRYAIGGRPDLGLRPSNIPSDPARAYPKHWGGWSHWLGSTNVAWSHLSSPGCRGRTLREWRKFRKAQLFARGLGLSGVRDWRAYVRGTKPNFPALPPDIPKTPNKVYARIGWISWAHWLTPISPKTYFSYSKAQHTVLAAGLRSKYKYLLRSQSNTLPRGLPPNPRAVYGATGEWTSWDLFLDRTLTAKARFLPFKKARAIVRRAKLRSHAEWLEYSRTSRPPNIPTTPASFYRHQGYSGLWDWLGITRKSRRIFQTKFGDRRDNCFHLVNWRPFSTARSFIRGLKLQGCRQYFDYIAGRLPDLPTPPVDIPSAPYRIYADSGWNGWGDWLGTGVSRVRKPWQFRPFPLARKFAHSLGFRSVRDWLDFAEGKRPDLPPFPADLPRFPFGVYNSHRDWKGMVDFLGYHYERRNKDFISYDAAKTAIALLGFFTEDDFRRASRERSLPSGVPLNPKNAYKRRGSWLGWRDFLGFPRRPRPTPAARPTRIDRGITELAQLSGISTDALIGLRPGVAATVLAELRAGRLTVPIEPKPKEFWLQNRGVGVKAITIFRTLGWVSAAPPVTQRAEVSRGDCFTQLAEMSGIPAGALMGLRPSVAAMVLAELKAGRLTIPIEPKSPTFWLQKRGVGINTIAFFRKLRWVSDGHHITQLAKVRGGEHFTQLSVMTGIPADVLMELRPRVVAMILAELKAGRLTIPIEPKSEKFWLQKKGVGALAIARFRALGWVSGIYG